jgi:aminobenzoyl-glutamate utilization protein B
MIRTAAKVVGATVVDLMSDADLLGRARQEWQERTGRIGGSRWIAPLLPSDFRVPNDFRWPEYISTARGAEWWIPTRSGDPQ